jgi:hypothetical protein
MVVMLQGNGERCEEKEEGGGLRRRQGWGENPCTSQTQNGGY